MKTETQPAISHGERSVSKLRAQATAMMKAGLLKLLNGASEAVVSDSQFADAMPPAFPWQPCTWGAILETAKAVPVTIGRDLAAQTVTLTRAAASTAPAPAVPPVVVPAPPVTAPPSGISEVMRLMTEAKNAPPAFVMPPLSKPPVSKPAPPEPDPVEISASARRMQMLLLKHHGVDVPISQCVRLSLARARGGAELLSDPLTLTRLVQLHQAEKAEAGLPMPTFEQSKAVIEKKLSKQ